MKKISRRIKRTLAPVLAAVMVLSTDAPFTLLEAMVANAEELVPDREKMPEVASETEADDPDDGDNSGGNNGGQPPADNGQDGDAQYLITSIKPLDKDIRYQSITEDQDIYMDVELPETLEAKNAAKDTVDLGVEWTLRDEEDIEDMKAGDIFYYDAEISDVDYMLDDDIDLPVIKVTVKEDVESGAYDPTIASPLNAPNNLQLKTLKIDTDEDGNPVYTVENLSELKEAYEKIEIQDEKTATIIIDGWIKYTRAEENNIYIGVSDKRVIYRSSDVDDINKTIHTDNTTVHLNGDCILDGRIFDNYVNKLYANGNYLELTENYYGRKITSLFGTKEDEPAKNVNLVLKAGEIGSLYGCAKPSNVTDKINITIDGCKIGTLYGAGQIHNHLAQGAHSEVEADVYIEFISGSIDTLYGGGLGQQARNSKPITRDVDGKITIIIGGGGEEGKTAEVDTVYGGGKFAYVDSVDITVYAGGEVNNLFSAGSSVKVKDHVYTNIDGGFALFLYSGGASSEYWNSYSDMTTEIGERPDTSKKPYTSDTPVKTILNSGVIGIIYGGSYMGKHDGLTGAEEELNQIYGNSLIELNGGRIADIYLSAVYGRIWGDSTVVIRDVGLSHVYTSSSIYGIPSSYPSEDSDAVYGDTKVIFDGSGDKSDSIELSTYMPWDKIERVDTISLIHNACVYGEGIFAEDIGSLKMEEGSVLVLEEPIEVNCLDLNAGAMLALCRKDGEFADHISGPASITVDEKLDGTATIYTVKPSERIFSNSNNVVENRIGLEISTPIDGEIYLRANSFSGTELSSGNKSQLFTLGNGDDNTYTEYINGSKISESYDHIWRIKGATANYTVEYYYDGVKGSITDENKADGMPGESESGAAGTSLEITPAEEVTYNGQKYVLDKSDPQSVFELSLDADSTKNVFKVQYKIDTNGDKEADYKQAYVRFDLGSNPYSAAFDMDQITWQNIVKDDEGGKRYIECWFTLEGEYAEADPVYPDIPVITETDKLIGWYLDDGTNYTTLEGQALRLTAGEHLTVTAHWTEGSDISLTPYDTTIYVGGSSDLNSSGFPGLELRVDVISDSGEAVSRPVIEENVESIIIDGVAQPDADIDKYLRVMYIGADQEASLDDSEPGLYTAKVVLTDDVVNPATGISTYGLAREAQTEGIYDGGDTLAASHEIYINGRKAQFADAQLIVRHVSDTEAARTEAMYRYIFTEEGTVAADGALAVIPSSSVIYTNDPKDGRVVDSRDGIRLFVDNLLSEGEDDSREDLLIAKANQVMGIDMTPDEARAAGYHYVIRYMDLVDTKNGNAWVSSSEGTDVYLPYQTDTTKDTEFRVIHFEELHREYGITGPAVEEAIAASNAVIMDATNTDYGIKFHTGVEGFSPFALVWHESGSFEDDVPGTDDDDHESSAPVSVGSGSSSSNDTYFTVGVTGNWMHMDNVDVNAELDEPVPAGADPISSPEWHRWKFFRSNGIMLYNQWAHIDNPFAVEGQPRTGWFYFDGTGLMRYGWYLDTRSGDWYYMHSKSDGMLGTMMTGWHYDESDGKWYYLDPATGAMATGWRQIDGKWYYFNPTPYGETWTLDHGTSVWRFNQSSIRPYGSMYQDEITPDGYRVGSDGAWIQ